MSKTGKKIKATIKKPSKVAKKSTKKAVKKEVLAGKVVHYFRNIKVGVLKLSAPLAEGDEIRIVGGENTDFTQRVQSMQVDHNPVKKARKGDDIGLKVKKHVREGYKVYKRIFLTVM